MPDEREHGPWTASPRRITAGNGPWPLLGADASRTLERAAQSREPQPPLMARAGFVIARLALALAPRARHAALLAGPGHNGGDGLIAARHLCEAGWTVTAWLTADAAALPREPAAAWQAAREAGVVFADSAQAALRGAPLVLDGLLGLGASRAPEGVFADAIAACNAAAESGACVLAIDLPSGLHADSGRALGPVVVRAHATLSLLSLKPGLFTGAGRELAGDIWFDDLGATPAAGSSLPADAWLGGPPPTLPRERLRHDAHKGRFGDVLVVGGSVGMQGAAWLAGAAALAAGAGRVYLSSPDGDTMPLPGLRPELMQRARAWGLAALAKATGCVGCGGGSGLATALTAMLPRLPRMVLDADAINALAGDAGLQRLLRLRAAQGAATLLTPHPLEAARLLRCDTAQVQRDRLAAAIELAQRFAATVLLKGSGSVVAATGDVPWINPTGNAALASPGTGDVLAGWAAGLWAQQPHATAAEVARAAAWQHGAAADRWAEAPNRRGRALFAAELIEAMRLLPAPSAAGQEPGAV